MENVFIFGSSILSVISLVIVGWFTKSYFPSYMKEKGKNTATKEDIEEITKIAEWVKQRSATELEELKSALNEQDKLLEKRREVYEDIVESLRLFISGHPATDEQKNHFYSACSKAWLWAPDPVLLALNEFLDIQVQLAQRDGGVEQQVAKAKYEKVVLEMRKDVGFSTTTESKYRFVTFN
ncbi:TPA: hypothetical protein RQK05_004567 [Vibrio vulnificus]|nr:hypothetical protein [Vibrio vulnificus]HDY7749841.1 hypothetical protein [Vibrio vulnificus]HDY7759204.1 hypothetical protein [Vibrio vulnificus]HDY7763852.1 hypothetical protein [Vibrio vulnificus]HDY7773024.1 hypothetical protein [Vibrio vulnificus]